MSSARIRVVAELKDFESLAGVWDSLLQRSEDENSIYLTHEWLSTWWRYFGEGSKLNILLIEKEHQIIGIVPLMKTEYRMGVLKLRALETIGAENYNYVGLMPPENREEAVNAFLSYLGEELALNGSVLRLRLIPEDSKLIAILKRRGAQFSRNLVIRETAMTLAPYVPLPATWDDYFRSLGWRRRKILRRALRSLEEEHRVEFQECPSDTLEDRLSEFFDLHQSRWQSIHVSGIFSDPKKREFYRDIATQFLKRKWLHFSYLNVDDEMVAAEYGFVHKGKLYGVTTARDIRFSKYSVGHLQHMFLIKDAIEKGLGEFDLLKGDEPYKLYWAKSARRYMQITVVRKGICPGLRLKSIHAFLRLHELSKYGLREFYSLYMMRRRERKERKQMGLPPEDL